MAAKEIESARQAIETERKAAFELKAEVAKLSVEIAERLLVKNLQILTSRRTRDKLISESTIN